MSGSGGISSLPSSRLTRILQEKAELLKKRRQTAEQVLKQVEERIHQLESIQVTLPEVKERQTAIRELSRRSEWEGVESQAKSLIEYLDAHGQAPFETRRTEIVDRSQRVAEFGTAVPAELTRLQKIVLAPPGGATWAGLLDDVVRLDAAVRAVESEFSASLRVRAFEVAKWLQEPADRTPELERKFTAALEPLLRGKLAEALDHLDATIRKELPASVERREKSRSTATAVLGAGRELGVPTEALQTALAVDGESPPLDWPKSVAAVDAAIAGAGEALRERVGATLDGLRGTLRSLPDYGVEPEASLTGLEAVASRVATVPPAELPGLLTDGRAVVEEPVVRIVAGLLDEVRPKIVEARRLGRDPSEVFAAMNRAREALRLKIYSEALAASQEAIDRVQQLTGDLDTLRDEVDSLENLLRRLQTAKIPSAPFEEPLRRTRAHLDRVEVEPARALLQETIRALGERAFQYLTDQANKLGQVIDVAHDRGFLPRGLPARLAEVRGMLEGGRLADAGESLASIESELRIAAAPFVARRVEEIAKGFEDFHDETLVAPVRRLLADADVNLRVKEDLVGSIESLRRAEREFSAVFAAHASSLVEGLEDERRTLDSMGGPGDELQRQIDEVQQIFNMGDFVKASKASQEIRVRALQQQLVRSEEAVSHAKLALVELGKMGLDVAELKGSLESAHTAAKSQKYLDAYLLATQTEEAAQRLRSTAQSTLDDLARSTERWQSLKQAGVPVDPAKEQLLAAKQAVQALDFDRARTVLSELGRFLEFEQNRAEAKRLLAEAELLIEDGRRLSVPTEPLEQAAAEARATLEGDRPQESLAKIRNAHLELVQSLRPVLEENLRAVERDLEVARSAGLEATDVMVALGEARRRLALPVPTGVAEIVERARTELIETRGFFEHAERALKRATESLSQAELVRANVGAAREKLAGLQEPFARREYAKVVESASSIDRELHQATYAEVSKTLAGFQGMVVRAKREGSDTSLAENLLHNARQALENGRPLEAVQLATRSEAELERVELQLRIAQSSFAMIEKRVAEAEQGQVVAPAAKEMLEAARGALQRKDYPTVLERAIGASDALRTAVEQQRRAREALDHAGRALKEAVDLGAEATEAVPKLDAARTAAQRGDYPVAILRAREVVEASRWAIERTYAGALAEMRQLIETARSGGDPTVLEAAITRLAEAESALGARDWAKATERLEGARADIFRVLDQLVRGRLEELDRRYGATGAIAPTEAESRAELARRVAELRDARAYGSLLQVVDEEIVRATEAHKAQLKKRLDALREWLLVGEKLGVDTTPVMELFSEAKLHVDAGRLEPVEPLLGRAGTELVTLVQGRLAERMRDVETELVYARDGLHVHPGTIAERLDQAARLKAGNQTVESARLLLEAEEELNRRKSAHRELMNLHYLIDAALVRAVDRRLDASAARKLIDESIRLQATDYAPALAKAREALQMLQELIRANEPTSGFLPFRRPPPKSNP
ncbi:MAG TPA: hypothetical protein VFF67_01680 [Thermoplasmata archaeon]|nr:hypothetical protein [Thermoplasmata archaeon]